MKEILIVEDDEILSRTLAHHLRADGWKVAEAQDCAAARALLRTAQYQLVLLDINLPGINDKYLLTHRSCRTYC